jgi:NAD(P)-dependent dehydrogenase (short-subunit alcohol dehydrogenase family)
VVGPSVNGWQQGEALTKMKEDLAKTLPMGRKGSPDETTKTVSFLASADVSYISGIEPFVDGGVAQI